MERTEADWAALRAEYLAGGIGQRALAEKHGVPFSALRRRAADEGWRALRDGPGEAAREARRGEAPGSDAELALGVRRRMLMMLGRMAEAMPADAVTECKSQEGGGYSLFKLRDMTAAYKELTDDLPLADGEPGGVRIVVDP